MYVLKLIDPLSLQYVSGVKEIVSMPVRGGSMESQKELKTSANSLFSDDYPIWECPDCGWLNRYANTFFELCGGCRADHTLDWEDYVIKPEEEV
jgi:hypothetical protein